MNTDAHGNYISPFSGKEVEGTLYDQPAKLLTDQAQWLANIGHRVSIRNDNGVLEVVKKEELPQIPTKR